VLVIPVRVPVLRPAAAAAQHAFASAPTSGERFGEGR
jgi:ABC-type transport system involved in cytochrome c biogenesis permease component